MYPTMKKINYMTPQTTVTEIKAKHGFLLSGSLTQEHATFFQEDATGEGMVKEQRQSDYNVWGDDWSK